MLADRYGLRIRRIHRQHNSATITLPEKVRVHLGVKVGDYLAFSYIEGQKHVKIFGVNQFGEKHGRKYGDRDRKDTGGGVRQAGDI